MALKENVEIGSGFRGNALDRWVRYRDITDLVSEVLASGSAIDHGGLTGLPDDDHPHYLLVAGTRALTGDWDAGAFEIRALTFESDVATGTPPLVVASTTLVTNLNADLWDGYEFANYLNQAVKTTSSPSLTDLTISAPVNIYLLNHDSFAGFVADEHVAHSGVSITAGSGLTGGGTIAASRTINVGSGTGISVTANAIALSHLGLEALTDPGADRIAFWDDSETAFKWLTPNTGLAIDGTNLNCSITQYTDEMAQDAVGNALGTGLTYNDGTGAISLSHLGIQSLVDPNADRILFWDDSESKTDWLACGDSIAITLTTLDTVQDIRTTASPTFVTVKCSGLADNTVPYHVADATGLADSPITVSGSTTIMASGALRLGVDDTTGGALTICGSNAANSGVAYFYLGTGSDTGFEYWRTGPEEDDFEIGLGTDFDAFKFTAEKDLHITAGTVSCYDLASNTVPYHVADATGLADSPITVDGTATVLASGVLRVGVDDTTRAIVTLYGSGAGTSATVYFYLGADNDALFEYWRLGPQSDDFLIGPASDIDAFKFTAEGDFIVDTGRCQARGFAFTDATGEAVTISGGVAAAGGTYNLLTVDTEGAAATDDLDEITGFGAGDIVVVRIANNARRVVVKNSTNLRIGADFTMTNVADTLALLCIGSNDFIQVTRSKNA